MPPAALDPKLRAGLRYHEIGNGSPYRLSFAKAAKSGASFGFMQGDLAVGGRLVTDTFRDVLTADQVPAAKIDALLTALSGHLVENPLSPADFGLVNDALLHQHALVDRMDAALLDTVYRGLDSCFATAATANRQIEDEAALMMAMWINMSGRPTRLLDWLSGGDPHLAKPVPPAGAIVRGADMQAYLAATDYYVNHPKNMAHLLEAVRVGMAA